MAKRAKREKAPPDPAIPRCVDAFYAAYVRKHNPPERAERWLKESAERVPLADRSIPREQMVLPRIIGGKDAALMKQMLTTWGEETVLRLIGLFFGAAYRDWGVVNSNQDIPALFAVAPRLLVRGETTTVDRRTAENLDAAQRAMTPRRA
jgi:hypothetical protein